MDRPRIYEGFLRAMGRQYVRHNDKVFAYTLRMFGPELVKLNLPKHKKTLLRGLFSSPRVTRSQSYEDIKACRKIWYKL